MKFPKSVCEDCGLTAIVCDVCGSCIKCHDDIEFPFVKKTSDGDARITPAQIKRINALRNS